MTALGLRLGDMKSVEWSRGRGRAIPVREDSPVTVFGDWDTPTGKTALPTNTRLSGRVYIGEKRVYGRFTEARTPSGETYPVCLELWDDDELGAVLASYREGEQRALEEARQCRWEKARLQIECTVQVGLTTLLSLQLMGKTGAPSKNLDKAVSARPGNTLMPMKARSYRSDIGREEGGRKRGRLAVDQELQNTGSTPWTLAGAVLVEVEVPEQEARGTFTLKLWSQEDSGRVELFDGVTFP
jgi:hypothetical protein